MSEEETKVFQLDILVTNLKELIQQGYGEVQYRLVVKNSQIEYISLTRTNTYRVKDDNI